MRRKWNKLLWTVPVMLITVAAALWVLMDRLQPAPPPVRALWVTRFDYTTPSDVQQIVRNVAAAGFTDLFFQIRGNGTAYYRSRLEPWAYELTGGSVDRLGSNPGWDPLQLAVDTARPLGLRVHAYMNVLPGWKGLEEPPASAGQLWTAHPDWFMVDSLGQKMLPTSGWYAFVNPVLPEVRAHLRGIVKELCGYEVAGIHLDYIRYPHDYLLVAGQRYPEATEDELKRRSDFSYDPTSLARLYDRYGGDVTKEEIGQFRRDSVTRVVQEISQVMQQCRPGKCVLSASVMGNPDEGRAHAYQDSGAWVREGLVDWAVQMNYGTRSFDRCLKRMRRVAGRQGFRRSVVVGINCKNDTADVLEQIDAALAVHSRGFALFSYTFLFDRAHRTTEMGRAVIERVRR